MNSSAPVEGASALIDKRIQELGDWRGKTLASLEGNVRRAIDIRESDAVDAAALTDLIRAVVVLNVQGKSKPKLRRASGKRSGKKFCIASF